MPAAAPPDDFVPFAQLGRASGLRGEIRLFPFGGAEREILEMLDEVYVDGLGRSRVQRIRRQGRRWILSLAGVRRREQAERLNHARLYAPASLLPAELLRPVAGAPLLLAGDTIGTVVELRGPTRELVLVQIGDSEVLLPLNAPYLRWDGSNLLLDDPPEGLLP